MSGYDDIADAYVTFKYNRPIDKAEDYVVTAIVNQLSASDKTIIDVGCGAGRILDHIYIQPDSYTGLDSSFRMIEHAKRAHPKHRFVLADIQDAGQLRKLGKYDVAISLFGALSYCPETPVAIVNIYNMLKNGGRFFAMLYSQKYQKRTSYIRLRQGKPAKHYETCAAHIESVCKRVGFVDVRMFGLSPHCDGSKDNFKLLAEKLMLSAMLDPADAGWFLCVSGEKP
jgi:SAM-dependent methyltransferase